MRSALFVLLAILALVGQAAAGPFGRFEGSVDTRWLEDGRRMELLSEYRYIDPKKVLWNAPKGWIVDGASIPQIGWAIIGGPYDQLYRGASVIHDVACDQKVRPWEDVHLAFYNAMRAAGVRPTKAKAMYAAVYYFGPRWPELIVDVVTESQVFARSEALRFEMASKGTLELVVRDHYIEGVGASGDLQRLPTGMKEISVLVTPFVNPMTPEDFNRLKAKILKQDVSLEQIRNAAQSAR